MPYKKENKICPECKVQFISERNKKFCSVSCGSIYTSRKKREILNNIEGSLFCSKCKEQKPDDQFNKCKTHKNRRGREFYCKKCAYKIKREIVYLKGEDLDLYLKGVLHKINYREKTKNSGEKTVISIKDLKNLFYLQEGKCAISGIPMTYFVGGRGKIDTNLSVDRIDNSKGYILENIHLVIYRVNIMRNDMEINEFLNICKIISNNV
jgi:hypothetical protein